MVGDHEVNATSRRLDVRLEQAVRALGAAAGAAGDLFEREGEVDVEVGGVEGAPLLVRGLGEGRCRCEGKKCYLPQMNTDE